MRSEEEKKAKLERRTARIEKVREHEKKLRESFERVSKTEDGLFVLMHLCRCSGFARHVRAIDRMGRVDGEGSAYNDGRRSIYIEEVRPRLSVSRLVAVEEAAENIDREEGGV